MLPATKSVLFFYYSKGNQWTAFVAGSNIQVRASNVFDVGVIDNNEKKKSNGSFATHLFKRITLIFKT
jgi:hypothetical protein